MEDTERQQELEGLGGWLMLFIVGLLYQLLSSLPMIANLGEMDFKGPVQWVFGLAQLATVPGALIVLVLLFAKCRWCPKFVIGFLSFVVATNIAYVAVLKSGSGGTMLEKTAIALSTIKCVAWILYFLSSKRVRNTFYGRLEPVEMTKSGDPEGESR